jgi:hypothetical protein
MFPPKDSDKKLNIDWQGTAWLDTYGNLNNTCRYILEKWEACLQKFIDKADFSDLAESIMIQAYHDSFNILILNLAKAYLAARAGKDSSMTVGVEYSDTVLIYSFECFKGTLEHHFADILKEYGYLKIAETAYDRTTSDMKAKGSLPDDKRNIYYHILFTVEEETIYLYAHSEYYGFTYQDKKTIKYNRDVPDESNQNQVDSAPKTQSLNSLLDIYDLTTLLRKHVEKVKYFVIPPEKAPMMDLLLDERNFNQIIAAATDKLNKGRADNQPHSVIIMGQGSGKKHFVHISTLPWNREQNRAFFARAGGGGYEEFIMQTVVDVIGKADPSSAMGGRNLQDQGYFHIIIEHVKDKIGMVHITCFPLSLGYGFISARRGNPINSDRVDSPFPLFWANDFLREPS